MNRDGNKKYETWIEPLLEALRRLPEIFLVGVAGIPGSGKSTFCRAVADRLSGAVVLPMDGYHIPRDRLSAEELRRRGAPHTFDHAALGADLEQLRSARTGSFPDFDHATTDPEPDAIEILPETTLVLVEGNYLLLQDWELTSYFDFTVFLDCEPDEAMRRVALRHVQSGIATTAEQARRKVEGNDWLNARLILAEGSRDRADLVVPY